MIKRKYLAEITAWLKKEKILILKWARQVWKTTILKEVESYIQKQNLWKTVFLYADRIDNQDIFASPSSFLSYLKYNFDFPNQFIFVFIDEFQFIDNAGLFLKNIFDLYKNKLQIIVSWSSSLEITKNSEFLTGRAIDFSIDRVSFWEFFCFNTAKENIPSFTLDGENRLREFYSVYKTQLENDFLMYLTYGWYPEVLIQQDNSVKERILSQIIETYISKDIVHFLKIENVQAFNNLVKLLSSNIWNLLNIHEVSSTLNTSMQTVNKYVDILEGTFVFSRVLPFFKNVRKELSKMPKIYVEDLWIKSYSLREFPSIRQKIDLWSEVENFIYNELSKKVEKKQIYFYRTIAKAEIDFVVEKKFGSYLLFEVRYRNKVTNLPVVMKNFEENYWKQKKIIITKDFISFQDDVYYIPACLFPFVQV